MKKKNIKLFKVCKIIYQKIIEMLKIYNHFQINNKRLIIKKYNMIKVQIILKQKNNC